MTEQTHMHMISCSSRPMCSVKNIDLCPDAKKEQIKKYQDMTIEELEKEVSQEQAKIEEAEANFEDEVQMLQEKFEQLSMEKDMPLRR